jgi:hypothetical protein
VAPAALLVEPAAGGAATAAPPPDLVPPLAADLPSPPAGLLGLWLATWAGGGGRTIVHVARGETRMRQAARAARAFAPSPEVLVLRHGTACPTTGPPPRARSWASGWRPCAG